MPSDVSKVVNGESASRSSSASTTRRFDSDPVGPPERHQRDPRLPLTRGAVGDRPAHPALPLAAPRPRRGCASFARTHPDHPAATSPQASSCSTAPSTDLEEVLSGHRPVPGAIAPGATDPGQMTPIPPGERLDTGLTPIPPARGSTSERPALERITMEREALAPHPRWRRFARAAIARRGRSRSSRCVAVALGVAGPGRAPAQILGGGNEWSPASRRRQPRGPAASASRCSTARSSPGWRRPGRRGRQESGFRPRPGLATAEAVSADAS